VEVLSGSRSSSLAACLTVDRYTSHTRRDHDVAGLICRARGSRWTLVRADVRGTGQRGRRKARRVRGFWRARTRRRGLDELFRDDFDELDAALDGCRARSKPRLTCG